MSHTDVIEVVRDSFKAPYRASDPHQPAANWCTIVVLESGGAAQYAQGLLQHGPREGNPPTARYAEGTLLFFSNDPAPRQATMGPFTPLEPLLVILRLLDQGVELELREAENPTQPILLLQWSAGSMVGAGKWGSVPATYVVNVEPPRAID